MLKASSRNYRSVGKFAFAVLLALTFCMAHPASTAYAKKRRAAPYGTIRIQSTPTGSAIEINGTRQDGTTTNGYRDFEHLKPGLYSIVIIFPNGKTWTGEVDLKAGRVKCVDATYRIHCWDYPLAASISKTSKDSDPIVTYKANVNYDGPETLKYIWTVSPSSAKIVSGGTGSPDIAIDTTNLNGEVKVSLLVDADDGSGDARCKMADEKTIDHKVVSCIQVSGVNVTSSSQYYRSGDKVTFTAHAEAPGSQLNYRWTVEPTPATISTGNGTESITVDTTGVSEETTITAKVEVDAGSDDPACPPAHAEASITCGADCGPVRNLNDLKARLDDFVTKLQTNPGAEGLVYIYGPRKKAETVSNQARTYLVSERGVDASRVNVQAIAAGDRVHFEFFVVGRGETPMPPDNRRVEQLEQPADLGIQHVPGYPRHSPAKHRRRRP